MKTISIKLSEQIQNLMKKKKSSLYNLMIAFFIRDKHIRKKNMKIISKKPSPENNQMCV